MADPISITASVTALATATFQVVKFLESMKDGGNDRLRITGEVNGLWMTLKLLEGQFESTKPNDEVWLKGVRMLQEPKGIFDQISEIIQELQAKLKPRTGARKALQTLRWPVIDKDDVERTIAHLERIKSSLSLILSNSSLAISQEIKADGAIVKDAVVGQKIKTLAEWLTPLNPLIRYNAMIKDCSSGSGGWFLKDDIFDEWKSGNGVLLWCPGIPGAGKSFMATIVMADLQRLFKDRKVAIFILYCSYNDPNTQSVESLLSCLLKQDVQRRATVDKKLEELYEGHYRKETRPTLDELKLLLSLALTQFEKSFIIIDALDEISNENRRLELLDSLCFLNEMTNIMVTSRRIPSIERLFLSSNIACDGCSAEDLPEYWHCLNCDGNGFDVCPSCHDQSVTCQKPGHTLSRSLRCKELAIEAAEHDLERYVQQRISASSSMRQCVAKKAELQDQIPTKVIQHARGMFLIAKFHMDALATKLRPSSIVNALNNLPSEIYSTYDQAMERICSLESEHQSIAKCFLSWVVHSNRLLTVREIEHATAACLMYENGENTSTLDEDDVITASDLSSMCAGMVVVESGFVRLVHETAASYFNETRGKWFPESWAKLAKTCLIYLKLKAFDQGPCSGETEEIDFEKRLASFPLLGFASSSWSHFASHAQDEELKKIALEFLRSEPHLQCSVQALWYSDTTNATLWEAKRGATALHLISFFGVDLVTDLLIENSDINAQDSLGITPLMYAAMWGSSNIADQLVKAGALINLVCQRKVNALQMATWGEHTEVVKVFLRYDELDVNFISPELGARSALMKAAMCGNSEIVGLLLQRQDLDVNQASNFERKNALMFAVLSDRFKIVELLLADSRIRLNDQNRWGETALFMAACWGDTSIVKILLDNNADPEVKCRESGTALLQAVCRGHIEVVRLLFEHEVDWMIKDKYDRTIIHYAAESANQEILRLILEQTFDLDVNMQDHCGKVPLHDCAGLGLADTVNVLLESGARTNIKDAEGKTPFRIAKESGHQRVFELILAAQSREIGPLMRAEPDLSTDGMPLWLAAKLGKKEVVDAVIEAAKTDKSIDLNAVDSIFAQTPLHKAVIAGHSEIVRSLLDAGADVNRQDRYGRTPIQFASLHGYNDLIVSVILDYSPDLGLVDQWDISPLEDAERLGYWKAALLLVENGAVLNTQDPYLHALLCAAATHGRPEVMLKLLKAGAEPQFKDYQGLTPYQLAKQNGHDDAARILLEHVAGTEQS